MAEFHTDLTRMILSHAESQRAQRHGAALVLASGCEHLVCVKSYPLVVDKNEIFVVLLCQCQPIYELLHIRIGCYE